MASKLELIRSIKGLEIYSERVSAFLQKTTFTEDGGRLPPISYEI